MATELEQSPSQGESDSEFQALMDQIRAGSQDAAWELIERYGHHILRAVRRMLNVNMRSKFDSIDFVQSVWASFFASRAKVVGFDRPEDLVRFLAAVAHNKVVDEVRRRLFYEQYNVKREFSIDDCGSSTMEVLGRRQATPSQIAVARERWNQMLAGQPEHYRRILQMRFMGESDEQIAAATGMHVRTVGKIVEKFFQE